jgi:hypothetical protein
LVLVGSSGCNGQPAPAPGPPSFPEAGASGTSPVPTSNLDIEGFWAIYANDMEPTVVSLHANGNAITGRGCLSGWLESTGDDASHQCGAITGTLNGSQVSFEFYFGTGTPWDTYGVSVQSLASGARMNGDHYFYRAKSPTNLWKGPATLFRPPLSPADESWPVSPLPMEVSSARLGPVTLLGEAPAGKFIPGSPYELETAWEGLRGDLGVFAPVDLTYEYPEAGVLLLHAGPVAQLDPGDPVSLEIEVRDGRVVSIEAALATGEMLSFAP